MSDEFITKSQFTDILQSKRDIGRPIVLHRCKCGESNPDNFLPKYKGICRKCKSKKSLARYYDIKGQTHTHTHTQSKPITKEDKLNDFVNEFFSEFDLRMHSKIIDLLRFAPHTVIEPILAEIKNEIEISLIMTYKLKI